jgi:4-oxalomesaconate tautomerase
MAQTAIPYHFFRGGTSRGPYFRREDLPEDREILAKVLLAALGSGQKLNIDGIGGGAAVTTKVAMLSKSETEGCDIDYFFAQVGVEDGLVDFKPTCGNILSGVGPAAIEMGLMAPQGDVTRIRVHSVNTGAKVEAVVSTPNGEVVYEGDAAIDGVPGTSAPIYLNFMDVVGSVTGALLPTGNLRDVIDGIEVTCMDVAMPVVIARASDFGLTGVESAAELDENRAFYDRMEPIRRAAGKLMGMGDVSNSVTPKFAILAKPQHGGTVTARYFMPKNCHPTMAVTGAQCLASCVLTPGTVAEGLFTAPQGQPALVLLEHPSGVIDVTVDYSDGPEGFQLNSAGLLRTARLLARGEVMVPSRIWAGK